jgi:protein gp37
MAKGSTIEWTKSTWNPVAGCNKVSPGCKYCYAERMAERLQAMGQPNYVNGFELRLQPQMLDAPLRWKKPQTVFVNSMDRAGLSGTYDHSRMSSQGFRPVRTLATSVREPLRRGTP